jgi:hypothetical protein
MKNAKKGGIYSIHGAGLIRVENFCRITSMEESARQTLGTGPGEDSSVGIASGYGLDDRGVGARVSVESRIFSTVSRLTLRSTQPPTQWVPGALSPGVKRQGHELDHSSSTSAEVKKIWIYTSTPPYAFMA